jgi:predicted heme/steroid binding protein
VILTASPATGSTFTGWSGGCTGTGNCAVTMGAAQNVTATFASAPATPGVSLNPSSLTFADQRIGTTSPAQSITLTNTGIGALTITSILSTTPVFSVTNNCGGGLAAGASCSLGVTFTPVAAGTRVGSIAVTSNTAGSPHSVTVSGVNLASIAPDCTLSASPPSVSKNGSSTLTASCSPAATSYVWTGGTCVVTTAATCSVTPTSNTSYTVQGANSAGKSNVASATVSVLPDSAIGLYDGIYVWSDGNYLSLHQDGSQMIATIYFNDNTSVDFKAASGGPVKVPQLDIFDLLSGAVTGATAKISGTRFHRACNVAYDFAFSNSSKLTVTRTNVSNTAIATASGISCSSIIANESPTMTMSKVPFGALAGSTPALAVGQYDGIYVWSDGNYLSLHQDGADFIATIYFNDNTSVDFRAASGGVLTVPQLDVFDLLSGSVTGSTSKIKGTRFHRACNVTYDFNFSGNVNLTATRTGISNTPLADAAGISCSAMLGSESGTISMRKIPFGQ